MRFFAGYLYFCSAESSIIGLAMGGVKFKSTVIAFGFSGWSWQKVLTIFRKCMTAKKGSQVFFSSE